MDFLLDLRRDGTQSFTIKYDARCVYFVDCWVSFLFKEIFKDSNF